MGSVADRVPADSGEGREPGAATEAVRPEACSNAGTPGKQLTALLGADASRYSWVAATTGSNSASGYQLATGDPVMAIGGFNGTDPAPTLAQFEKYVAEGRIHYYIGGGGRRRRRIRRRRLLGRLVGFADRLLGVQPLRRPDRRRGDRLRPGRPVLAGGRAAIPSTGP